MEGVPGEGVTAGLLGAADDRAAAELSTVSNV
jgi:hypothetical protein